jgi:hypothetical protein
MRKRLYGRMSLAACGLLVLAAAPSNARDTKQAQAKRSVSAVEKSLFGIRIWRSWSEVLSKFGQPNRVEVGGAANGGVGIAGGPGGFGGDMPAGGTGGGASLTGGGMLPRPPGGPGALPGLPGSSLPPGLIGGGGGGMLDGPAAMGGGMPPGMTGYGGGMGGKGGGGRFGGGMPGGMLGGPAGGDDAAGGAGGFNAGLAVSDVAEGEVSWNYDKPNGNSMAFLFNKDGRVVQISSFGYTGGAVTSRNIHLGSSLKEVYRAYGWTDNTHKSGNSLTLNYSRKSKVAFHLLDKRDGKGYKVVGIIVALTERDTLGY